MRQLERYIHPYWGFIFLTMFTKLMGAVTELLVPFYMEIILDEKVPAGDRLGIYLCGGMMLLCAFLCWLFNVIANRMSARSSGQGASYRPPR